MPFGATHLLKLSHEFVHSLIATKNLRFYFLNFSKGDRALILENNTFQVVGKLVANIRT